MKLYRFLTEDDTSAFCHKVSAALSKGWELHGSPQYAYDHANGVMRCGQAVTKDIDGAYSPDMTLGQQ
ncbi:MAG: putative conserved small protein [Rhodobacteraceae bacterium HLUCCA08]|nr:MAG: putative conserved small protein [Rhodobacteraceae bacterium HLUCCA08]